jgi:hypothetical protein
MRRSFMYNMQGKSSFVLVSVYERLSRVDQETTSTAYAEIVSTASTATDFSTMRVRTYSDLMPRFGLDICLSFVCQMCWKCGCILDERKCTATEPLRLHVHSSPNRRFFLREPSHSPFTLCGMTGLVWKK